MHIYNNHSFRINVFYFEIFLDALAPLKTMLLMNKNQSVSNREARMVRGMEECVFTTIIFSRWGSTGSHFLFFFLYSTLMIPIKPSIILTLLLYCETLPCAVLVRFLP